MDPVLCIPVRLPAYFDGKTCKQGNQATATCSFGFYDKLDDCKGNCSSRDWPPFAQFNWN